MEIKHQKNLFLNSDNFEMFFSGEEAQKAIKKIDRNKYDYKLKKYRDNKIVIFKFIKI
jgi:hypothetical protein